MIIDITDTTISIKFDGDGGGDESNDGFVTIQNSAEFDKWGGDELVEFINDRLKDHQISVDDLPQL